MYAATPNDTANPKNNQRIPWMAKDKVRLSRDMDKENNELRGYIRRRSITTISPRELRQ